MKRFKKLETIVRLPKEKEMWGSDAFHVHKTFGTTCGLDDWAVWNMGALGFETSTINNRKTGYIWSASRNGGGDVRCAYYDGDKYWDSTENRKISARPALPKSTLSLIRPDEIRPGGKISVFSTVYFGKHLTDVAGIRTNEILENLFQQNKLAPFTDIDSRIIDVKYNGFKTSDIYEYNNNLWVRKVAITANSNSMSAGGHYVSDGDAGWFTPQSYRWFSSGCNGNLLSVNANIANVPFDDGLYNGNFETTVMYNFLNTVWFPQLLMFANLRLDESNPKAAAEHNAVLFDRIYSLVLAIGELENIHESGAATDAEIAAEFNRAIGKNGIPPYVSKMLGIQK